MSGLGVPFSDESVAGVPISDESDKSDRSDAAIVHPKGAIQLAPGQGSQSR